MVAVERITVEVDGIPVTIDRETMDDVEVMELLGEMEDNPFVLPRLMRLVLGDEQYANVKRSLRRDGRCHVSDLLPFFSQVLKESGEQAKNS